ncbi:FAD/NAD(P)-binding domain-containing protein [Viridothelium virens]|uniref:FAD/NAD(P)-binding domain-containing protein n=1 Tax=Viridothelium virens TaxID=1048519 RepID=A0A6A6HGT1_VIRVR|nr:FAD/NAD(P)-binding domain-containing protein [Viridothelium virens]
MAPLKILICGGGCAGPSLAFWLARCGHHCTIVERFPALRASGAQIDLRAQGIQVAKRMGLLDVIRSKLVDEAGVVMVDTQGNSKATFMANKSGKGAQTGTSEYEIMRGDLVRILYDVTKDNVNYVFGKTVEHFEQDERCVTVHFSDGQIDTYDLLVGADGQGSRIRQAILPPDSPDTVRRLGVYMGYWFVPRADTDNNYRKMYHIPGSRMVMSRVHSPTEGQAYFTFRDDSEELRSLLRAPVETQKEFWAQKFQGSGWQTDRLLQGMKTTENFYCQDVVQIRTDTWSKGRVALLADAAHCPSPLSGMGTTGALVGAYVLAAEINRNSNNLPQAFANYDKVLRPFVNEIQKFNPLFVTLAWPKTSFGIMILHFIAGLLAFFRIPDIVARLSKEEKGGWLVPEYPELKSALQA